MEGKSLFTCHQCGALLKFQHSPVSIEEKIMKLRPVAYEHPSQVSEQQRGSKGDDEEEPSQPARIEPAEQPSEPVETEVVTDRRS